MSPRHSDGSATWRSESASQPDTSECTAWGWKWVVVRKWLAHLETDRAIPIDALADWPAAALLKQGIDRSVWRFPLGDAMVVAKVYDRPTGLNQIKVALLGSPARREFSAALYGLHHNLPIVRPVAYGTGRSEGRSTCHALLTEAVSGATDLAQHWAAREHPARGLLVRQAAEFVARLHGGGFVPADLHPGNILVDASDGLVLVDLHKASFPILANPAKRIRNLSDLNQWFQRHASRSDRLRFLGRYLEVAFGSTSRRDLRSYARLINLRTGRNARALQIRRDRRIFGTNNYFAKLRLSDHWTAHVVLRARGAAPASACSSIQFSAADWTRTLEVMLSSVPDPGPADLRIGPRTFAVTILRERGSADRLRNLWQEEHLKLNRHVRVPVPLALLERHCQPGAEAILIIERLETA